MLDIPGATMRKEMRNRYAAVLTLSVIVLAGCSSDEPAKPKEPAKPAEAVTGRYAFYQVYPTARLWAADIQGLRVSSIAVNDVKGSPGRAGHGK